jgi:hypothetical protein
MGQAAAVVLAAVVLVAVRVEELLVNVVVLVVVLVVVDVVVVDVVDVVVGLVVVDGSRQTIWPLVPRVSIEPGGHSPMQRPWYRRRFAWQTRQDSAMVPVVAGSHVAQRPNRGWHGLSQTRAKSPAPRGM